MNRGHLQRLRSDRISLIRGVIGALHAGRDVADRLLGRFHVGSSGEAFMPAQTLVHSVSFILPPIAAFTTEPFGMSNWLRTWKAASTASSAVSLGTAAWL